MRTVTIRVPDDWHGLVDSWAVQVMLQDFFRNHVYSELAADPQPGRARLSLSLPEFRTDGIPESVFLRRLIASYLPALKSFRSSRRAVPLAHLQRRVPETEMRVVEQKALPAQGKVWAESDRLEGAPNYSRDRVYRMRRFPGGLEGGDSSDATRLLSDLGDEARRASIKVLVMAVLLLVLFLFFIGKSTLNAADSTTGSRYQPWNPKGL
jgi:hypothetical protein